MRIYKFPSSWDLQSRGEAVHKFKNCKSWLIHGKAGATYYHRRVTTFSLGVTESCPEEWWIRCEWGENREDGYLWPVWKTLGQKKQRVNWEGQYVCRKREWAGFAPFPILPTQKVPLLWSFLEILQLKMACPSFQLLTIPCNSYKHAYHRLPGFVIIWLSKLYRKHLEKRVCLLPSLYLLVWCVLERYLLNKVSFSYACYC